MGGNRISVIIPAYNEAAAIGATIASLRDADVHEVIVADGGSSDDTAIVAELAGAEVVSTAPGRAVQMNEAAERSTGDILLFLHADTRLPAGFSDVATRTLGTPGVVAGAFTLSIDSPRISLRIIESLVRLRCRLFSLPYGDQAIFMRRDVFFGNGGWPELPIMEDYELMRRLVRRGRVMVAPESVVTSARRWERLGVLRATVINQFVIIGYALGVFPDRLMKLYRR